LSIIAVKSRGFLIAGPTSGKTTVATNGQKVGVQFWDADCLWKVLFPWAKEKELTKFPPEARALINQLKGVAETLAGALVAGEAVPLLSFRTREAARIVPKGGALVIGRDAKGMVITSRQRGDDMSLSLCQQIERMGQETARRLSTDFVALKSGEYLAQYLYGDDANLAAGDSKAQHEQDAATLVELVDRRSQSAAKLLGQAVSSWKKLSAESRDPLVSVWMRTPDGGSVVIEDKVRLSEAQRHLMRMDEKDRLLCRLVDPSGKAIMRD
jgi:hypothetical protein